MTDKRYVKLAINTVRRDIQRLKHQHQSLETSIEFLNDEYGEYSNTIHQIEKIMESIDSEIFSLSNKLQHFEDLVLGDDEDEE